VRVFQTFTSDLHDIAAWLKQCGRLPEFDSNEIASWEVCENRISKFERP
jgi:hypothetical protein